MQDAFNELLKTLCDLLRLTIGRKLGGSAQTQTSLDDDFGPVRSAHTAVSSAVFHDPATMFYRRCIIKTCVTALAVVPILQTPSGEPTRSKELTELILDSDPNEFLLLAPPFCDQIRDRTLSVTTPTLQALLEKLNGICRPYAYRHSDETLLLVVQLLSATSSMWLQPSVSSTEVGENARHYCLQMTSRLQAKSQRSWRVQDAIIRFLDTYLAQDPKQEIWQLPVGDEDTGPLPTAILPTLSQSRDIRIRFRISTMVPRLFAVGRQSGCDLLQEVYQEIHTNLSSDLNEYVIVRYY